MAISLNTKVEFYTKATSFKTLSSYGDIMIGNKAFEYYNQRNVEDFIQIPYDEIEKVVANVMFGKYISRFTIYTQQKYNFSFSARNARKCLVVLSKHIGKDKFEKPLSVIKTLKLGINAIFRKRK